MGGYGKEILPKGYYLMEVKILGAMPVWLTKTLSELKIYNTHFSKYGNEYMGYCLNNTYDIRRKNIC